MMMIMKITLQPVFLQIPNNICYEPHMLLPIMMYIQIKYNDSTSTD